MSTTTIHVSFSPPNWSPDMQLTWDAKWDAAPAVVLGSDQRIWVFWHSYRTGNAEIFYKIYDSSQVHRWSSEIQLTNNPGIDITPYAVQTADGKIWVVWMTNRMGNYEIFYKIFNGTSWSNDIRLTFDSSRDEMPAVLQTLDGKIWVFWDSFRGASYDIFYNATIDNGETWTWGQLTFSTYDEWDPSVMRAIDGKIWLAFTKRDDIYYMVYDGVSWSAETQLVKDPSDDWHSSIMQDSDGKIWVFWDSNRILYEGLPQTDIFYKVYDGVSWSAELQLTTEPAEEDDMPFAVQDNSGTLWIFWMTDRASNADIYYRTNLVPFSHDVEIFSVLPSTYALEWGENTTIEVVARNHGTNNETIEVRCYANDTLIGAKTVQNLTAGRLYPIYFTMYSTDLTWGNYTISATATPVLGETNTDDNTFVDGTVTIQWHDIAVLNVTTFKNVVSQGFPMNINVTVQNQGTKVESFNLTICYNETIIETKNLTLGSGNSLNVTFTWNTTNVVRGKYVISAYVEIIPNENDLWDNLKVDDYVIVTIPGDVNGDKIVNIHDLAELGKAYGTTLSKPRWDAEADIDNNGVVDILDLTIVNENYGNIGQ